MPPRPHATRALAAAAVLLLAGCAAQMQPVADFGGAASRLAAVYKPFGRGIARSCEQRQRYVALGNAGAFSDAAAETAAARTCAPLREAGATAALFAQALSDYAGALAKLSGAKATVFDGEIKGVSSAAGDLEKRDGTALFDSHKLAAATRIARAAAVMLQEGRLQVLTRATLEDNRAPLKDVVDAMKTYAGSIYAGQLVDTRDVMRGELGRLVKASDAPTQADVEARMPWRLAQSGTRADIAANEQEVRRVHEFLASADALLAAHESLIENFDKLGGARRLELVAAFVKRVQAINDDAAEL